MKMLRKLNNTLNAAAARIADYLSWGPSVSDQFWANMQVIDRETIAHKMRLNEYGTINNAALVWPLDAPQPDDDDINDLNVNSMYPLPPFKLEPELSERANKLLTRIRAGEFYTVYDRDGLNKRTPKAMQELIDAGLVVQAGRVETVVRCYVPKGFIPHQPEQFPDDK